MARIEPVEFVLSTGEKGVIRNPEPRDATALMQALNSVVAEEDYLLLEIGELNFTAMQEITWIQQKNRSQNEIYLVACVEGKILGGISLTQDTPWRRKHTGMIGMFVVQGWRHRGIGRQLMQTLIDWATQHETLEKLCLEVFHHNQPALALYRQMGFVEEGYRPRHAKSASGKYYDEIVMALFVKQPPVSSGATVQ